MSLIDCKVHGSACRTTSRPCPCRVANPRRPATGALLAFFGSSGLYLCYLLWCPGFYCVFGHNKTFYCLRAFCGSGVYRGVKRDRLLLEKACREKKGITGSSVFGLDAWVDRKRGTGSRSRTLAPPRGAAWIADLEVSTLGEVN
jgi:hypothetical protein